MPTIYKLLGQKAPGNTWTDLYVPGTSPATSSIVSSIVVCNTGSFDRKFSIAVVPATGITPTTSGSIAFNTTVIASDSIVLSMGITLGPGNALRVYASGSGATSPGDVGFSAFGTEIT
jgi:hypothetical protein